MCPFHRHTRALRFLGGMAAVVALVPRRSPMCSKPWLIHGTAGRDEPVTAFAYPLRRASLFAKMEMRPPSMM